MSDKIATVLATNADTLISCDMGCLMHIGGGLSRQGHQVSVQHIAEILDTTSRSRGVSPWLRLRLANSLRLPAPPCKTPTCAAPCGRWAAGLMMPALTPLKRSVGRLGKSGGKRRAKSRFHALDHLDYYLELLHDRVTEAGGHVHFARDSAQANAIVAEIARSHQVKIATKSKSMVSEELDLNRTLEAAGIDVYETDLGEYIIQLAEETPSHLVAPGPPQDQGASFRAFPRQVGRTPHRRH